MDFHHIKDAVAAKFAKMQKSKNLFRVNASGDKVYETYLSSFPAGTNPIFRERSEHDCACCRQFIKAIGNVVEIKDDGTVSSVWDVNIPAEPGYQVVADAMASLVQSKQINDFFMHYESKVGTERSIEDIVGGKQLTWTHFSSNIDRKFVKNGSDIPTLLGELRSKVQVFGRGLREIEMEAIDTVLELIDQDSLYRGAEYKFAVSAFKELKQKYHASSNPDLFAWINAAEVSGAISGIRNTSIGSLLTDLSEGVGLDAAVASFETKVAGNNYKRPKALVTASMIANAQTTIKELGLESALSRRHARLTDITVNNVLFADRTSRVKMNGSVLDDMLSEATSKKSKSLDKVEEIHIEKFISDVLPKAESIEVLFESHHMPNLMSLVAPSDPTAGKMFKWGNNFTWSYTGGYADSIKEKVKNAGGNVTGDLCCRLAWYNHDDLDFHMIEPNRNEISFARKISNITAGRLDVDMNAGYGTTREPVENIFYASRKTMVEGEYRLFVRQFSKRESSNVGFDVEIDYMGTVHKFSYPQSVNGDITVATFKYTHKDGIKITAGLPSTSVSKLVSGVTTETFQKVNLMMLSPNYWDNQGVGNKHYFFILDGCKNDGEVRGFLNEFLKEDLNKHRKVFEVVGSKMKVEDSPEQLSGLGFSSTQRNHLTCRVTGAFSRVVKIVF